MIEIRDTVPGDLESLAAIVDDEWKFRLYSEENGARLALHYVLHCIDGSNAFQTLLVDGVPKGLLVLRDMDGPKRELSPEERSIIDDIMDDPGTGRYLEDFDVLYDTYLWFARKFKGPESAELRLIIVSEDCKGMGLGRILIDKAAELARARGKSALFFYTDTDCNVGFYDHLGARRLGVRTVMCMGVPLDVMGYQLDI